MIFFFSSAARVFRSRRHHRQCSSHRPHFTMPRAIDLERFISYLAVRKHFLFCGFASSWIYAVLSHLNCSPFALFGFLDSFQISAQSCAPVQSPIASFSATAQLNTDTGEKKLLVFVRIAATAAVVGVRKASKIGQIKPERQFVQRGSPKPPCMRTMSLSKSITTNEMLARPDQSLNKRCALVELLQPRSTWRAYFLVKFNVESILVRKHTAVMVSVVSCG